MMGIWGICGCIMGICVSMMGIWGCMCMYDVCMVDIWMCDAYMGLFLEV